jgi:hypothetical protein
MGARSGKVLEPGTVHGDPETEGALGGLLAGAVPFGSPPRRGERELMVAAKRRPILHSMVNRIGHDIARDRAQRRGNAVQLWPVPGYWIYRTAHQVSLHGAPGAV